MDAGPPPVRRMLVARARRWRRPRGRACAADRRFPVFRLLSHCYFSFARRRREPKSAALRTTPDCGRRLTHWRRDKSRFGRGAHLRCREEELQGWETAVTVFPLLFTMRVVGTLRLQLQPTVELTGGGAHQRTH